MVFVPCKTYGCSVRILTRTAQAPGVGLAVRVYRSGTLSVTAVEGVLKHLFYDRPEVNVEAILPVLC